MTRLLLGTMLSLAALLGGCKQKEGERCQVQDDCEEGLECSQATQTCASGVEGDLDALPPIDAPADAPSDAGPDAMIDAAVP